MSFAEIAEKRRLRSVASHLGQLTWDVEADGYQRLRVPPTADVDALLKLLLRRGLDPALVAMLLDRFESRPVERALIAWDIAAGALLGPDDDALAKRVRSHLSPLRQLGASPRVAVPRDRVEGLIKSATAIGDRPLPDSGAPSLASVAALSASDTAGIDAALAFADKAAAAHLPSLALAYAQILWATHAVPDALDRLVEIALDFERFDSMPLVMADDDRSLVRQTYFGVRVALAQLDTAAAASILADMDQHPAIGTSTDHRLAAARAELDLLSDKPLAGSNPVDALVPVGSTWRYGTRVRDEIQIQLAPENAAITVDGFLGSFGSDLRVWAQAGYHDGVRADLLALVSREVRYCSYNPDAWRALAVFAEDGTPIEIELQQRSAEQLATALA